MLGSISWDSSVNSIYSQGYFKTASDGVHDNEISA